MEQELERLRKEFSELKANFNRVDKMLASQSAVVQKLLEGREELLQQIESLRRRLESSQQEHKTS